MADYWKSQPKKFCQYCKCWIADNKPSIEFHERGKNHKENVAAKIEEIKKKSIDKAKKDERMSKEFAAMEEAALKAYQEDMKRMGLETGSQGQTTIQTQPLPQKREEPKKHNQKKKSVKPKEAVVWLEGKTDDGHTYYYNSITGESQWENPEGFQGGRSAYIELGQSESSSSASPWMEAVSPEGYTYYYNTESGGEFKSSWERPADFPPKEDSGSGSSKEGEGQEEPSTPQPEPLSVADESSNGAKASTEEQPKVSKISFRKRKVEAEPSNEERQDTPEGDKNSEDDNGEKGEDKAQETAAEPEKKEEKKETQAKRPRTANPYGTWEQIKIEEDPYAKVDLQLPQVEGSASNAPDGPPPEPKPKFKERTITSLGDEGGSASFRKSKTQNGKSRSLRQRASDD